MSVVALPSPTLDAEHALLGAAMFEPSALERCEGVRPEHFADAFHGRLWSLIVERAREGRSSEPSLLAAALGDDAGLRELGGVSFLADLYDKAPALPVVADYAAAVRDGASRRSLRELAVEIGHRINEPVEPLLAEAERRVMELARDGASRDAWEPVSEVMDRAFVRARERRGMAGIPTGIHELDMILGGLRPGTVNIMGGRPGMGKTAHATQLAVNVARQRRGVGFVSLEEPEETLPARFACTLAYDRSAPFYSGVSSNPSYEAFQRGDLTERQWERLEQGREVLNRLPISFDFRSRLKPSQILAAGRRLQRQWERKGVLPGLLIIDHLLHVAPERSTGNRVQDVGAISGDLLHAAKALNMPIVLLCQLSRAVEGRDDKRPGLPDLRWAGEIEQDAFSVTFLYRPAYYAREPEDATDDRAMERYLKLRAQANELHFLIEKNRGGKTGMARAFVDIACNAIDDLEPVR